MEQTIALLIKKHARIALNKLDKKQLSDPVIRKIVLDALNELGRDITAIITPDVKEEV
jgi:hypothetical protein